MRLTFASTVLLLSAALALATVAEAPWSNLDHVTWKRPYTFILRDGSRVEGLLVKVDSTSATVERSGSNVTVKREEVVRVTDGSGEDDVIYNGRNTWTDAGKIKPQRGELLRILLKNGTEYTGAEAKVSVSEITLDGRSIAKPQVLRIFYERARPSKSPDQHGKVMKIPRRISVLLYDSTVPESGS